MNSLNNGGGAMHCGVVAVVLGTMWILPLFGPQYRN